MEGSLMLKVRLHGSIGTIEEAIASFKENYTVLSISKLYKDRSSELYRVYIEMTLKEKG
jgi:hypothetical protein